jgi:SAM-dependent methyltransferase
MSSEHDNWDRHWQDYAESAETNPAQKWRRQIILSLLRLDRFADGVRLLDIGSGQGDFAAYVHARFANAEILGLELSESGVRMAARKVPSARFVQCDLLAGRVPSDGDRNWATHAVCSEVLEHVDEPRRLLENARAYMAPGCALIVTVPGGPMSAFDKHIGHRKHYRPEELRQLLRDAGYEVQVAAGAGFPFFNLYRCVVILRGEKLVQDVSAAQGRPASLAARAAMATFNPLFRLNFNSGRAGWQILASARVPDASSEK